jgi:hypothetical protein
MCDISVDGFTLILYTPMRTSLLMTRNSQAGAQKLKSDADEETLGKYLLIVRGHSDQVLYDFHHRAAPVNDLPSVKE